MNLIGYEATQLYIFLHIEKRKQTYSVFGTKLSRLCRPESGTLDSTCCFPRKPSAPPEKNTQAQSYQHN